MLQAVVVALIVAIAATYASWHAMPARWRQALARRLAPRAPGLAATLARQPGCGACDRCGACDDGGRSAERPRVSTQARVVSGPLPRAGSSRRPDADQDRA